MEIRKRTLMTERLCLRPYKEDDVPQLVELLTDERITKTFMVPDFTSKAQAEDLACKLVEFSQPEDVKHLEYGIILDEKLIGFINDCGFENEEIEIGYVMHPDYQGKGYTTEAVKAIIKELFDMGFNKVTAGFFEDNIASLRVMEKCGMKLTDEVEEEEYRGITHRCLNCEITKNMLGEEVHKRRVRYSGKYPKKFEEKYKEHNPEKYADTIAHVIEKGSTPAGMHISIMVKEILDFLQIKPGQKGLDCTLGYGGHTRKMLEQLRGDGLVVGLDVDSIESTKTVKRLRDAGFGEDVFQFKLTNFANIDEVAAEYGKFDFVLADLGVSSMQIDNPERGFSYKTEGPLDLRLDSMHGESAAQRLRSITQREFEGMLIENSDEPYAAEIAEKVFGKMYRGAKMDTTTELREAVEEALVFLPKAERSDAVKKSCARTFQALRIDVNSEFEVLYSFLEKLDGILNEGGHVAVLTFHSGEDRLVKKAFKELKRAGIYSEISTDVIRPSAEECRMNPRAKSTKMRWAIKA